MTMTYTAIIKIALANIGVCDFYWYRFSPSESLHVLLSEVLLGTKHVVALVRGVLLTMHGLLHLLELMLCIEAMAGSQKLLSHTTGMSTSSALICVTALDVFEDRQHASS